MQDPIPAAPPRNVAAAHLAPPSVTFPNATFPNVAFPNVAPGRFAPARFARAACAVLLSAALLAGCASTDAEAAPPEAADDEAAEMMALFAAHGTPGAFHEHLHRKIGNWTTVTKMWSAPGTDPVVSESTSTIEPVYDGLFIRERTMGSMGGAPFTGEGLMGYDNAAKQFHSIWFDSMSSGMYWAVGECRKDCRVMEFHGSGSDPITGGVLHYRYVQTDLGDDGFVFEIFQQADGSEWRVMETHYTRL